MADEMHAFRTAGIDQRQHIVYQIVDAVVASPLRPRAGGVAALQRRQTPVALGGQTVDDRLVHRVGIREAMQENDHRPVGGPVSITSKTRSPRRNCSIG
jgi:hypothetical protein